jgi:diguanylate cyclase (GGDEF)-like protein
MREALMTARNSKVFTAGQGVRKALSLANHRSNAGVPSAGRWQDPARETLEALLSSTLRSEDAELDQILSALEEISNSVKSGAPNARNLDSALQQAASCAVKQSLLDREVRSLAITDELTGLCNRRGFLASATHQLKLAHRNAQNVMLLFCDLDNLKGINDSFGHPEGDLALIRTADALKQTFRDSDILARLGGDEFAVLASEAFIPNRRTIVSRMENSLANANASELRYKLSFSIGIARFDPETPTALGELMARADQDMYAHKECLPRSASLGHS